MTKKNAAAAAKVDKRHKKTVVYNGKEITFVATKFLNAELRQLGEEEEEEGAEDDDLVDGLLALELKQGNRDSDDEEGDGDEELDADEDEEDEGTAPAEARSTRRCIGFLIAACFLSPLLIT